MIDREEMETRKFIARSAIALVYEKIPVQAGKFPHSPVPALHAVEQPEEKRTAVRYGLQTLFYIPDTVLMPEARLIVKLDGPCYWDDLRLRVAIQKKLASVRLNAVDVDGVPVEWNGTEFYYCGK
jgi:hypothetical protein